MRNLMRTIAAAALACAMTMPADATEGWYGRVDFGYSVDGGLDISPEGAPFATNFGGDTSFEDEAMGSAGAGYAFQNGFRLEGELSFRDNDIEPIPTVDAGGSARATAAMLNLYYDFNRNGGIQPYLGVGVGAARLDVQATDLVTFSKTLEEEDTVAAYQALAGVGFTLSPQLSLDVGYRYFKTEELSGTGDAFFTTTSFPYDAEYTHQAATIGLRWQFAGPAAAPVSAATPVPTPAPVPTSAPCPASSFTVYFEWDRANLNAPALEVVDQAVTRARQCNISGALVVGHTDTSGTPQYNVALSERRAGVVRDALTSRGLAASAITTEARGETDPAQATRDGVREPLNRRTAVTISFR